MKTIYTFFALLFFIPVLYGQEEKPIPDDKNQPDVKINVKKEYDDDGNVIRFDSTYSWSRSNQDEYNGEIFKQYEEKMEALKDNMGMWDDGFFDLLYENDTLKNMWDFPGNLNLGLKDSIFNNDQWGDLFKDDHFQFHGFNFDGNNFNIMPYNKEKIEELEKWMKDLNNGAFDERIKKFIEEHKDEIDKIKYEIRESIPKNRKAI